jgi:hypothetical protein
MKPYAALSVSTIQNLVGVTPFAPWSDGAVFLGPGLVLRRPTARARVALRHGQAGLFEGGFGGRELNLRMHTGSGVGG